MAVQDALCVEQAVVEYISFHHILLTDSYEH